MLCIWNAYFCNFLTNNIVQVLSLFNGQANIVISSKDPCEKRKL